MWWPIFERFFRNYVLITYGVCKKRKYCNRMSEKKNSFLLTNVYVLYVLEDKTSKIVHYATSAKKTFFRTSIVRNFISRGVKMRISAREACVKRLYVCLSVCRWTFAVDTITFEGISRSKENLVGVFYVWNVGLVLKSVVK